MLKSVKTAVLAAIGLMAVSNAANAHFVTFAWKDNGDGTTTLFGEHWHGNIAPTSDNGGLHIYDSAGTTLLFTTPWMGQLNGVYRDDMLADGTLTGFQTGLNSSSYNYGDWFYTAPIALGNGDYNFFTGTSCCVDTMEAKLTVNVTGIVSVPPEGTEVPEPATLALMGLGVAGLGLVRRRRKAA